jgi:uncharacterized membrane protein YpjA
MLQAKASGKVILKRDRNQPDHIVVRFSPDLPDCCLFITFSPVYFKIKKIGNKLDRPLFHP